MRRLLVALIALFVTFADARAAELNRIWVGFPPGQATDLIARLLADKLGPALGETVIVENRPGQGGSMALASLASAAADGHTMVLAPLASLVVNPHMYKTVGYDSLKDFAPVALIGDLPMLMVVNPSLPIKDVADLVAYAKANPGKLANPSAGNGTLSHLGMEEFKQRAGVSILHVPYRGSPPALTDLMAGVVGVAIDTVTVTEPLIRAGKLRLIASAYGQRVPAFPDTPTLAEQGFPGFDLAAWLGIVVPVATPKDRVERLSAALTAIVQTPEMREKFALLGTIPRPLASPDFAAYLAQQDGHWSGVVKAAGITIE
jgi:tripartite-type tricarboxylate transporter receptor subunit TctC